MRAGANESSPASRSLTGEDADTLERFQRAAISRTPWSRRHDPAGGLTTQEYGIFPYATPRFKRWVATGPTVFSPLLTNQTGDGLGGTRPETGGARSMGRVGTEYLDWLSWAQFLAMRGLRGNPPRWRVALLGVRREPSRRIHRD